MDEARDRVKVTYIGIQGAGDSTVKDAATIYHALKAYDYIDSLVQFSGHDTNT